MNTRAIILDADGMIVHGTRFSTRLAADFGITQDMTRTFFENEFQLCLIGAADLKEEVAKYLPQWGWKRGVDELLKYWFAEEYTLIEKKFLPIIQEIRERGVAVYLATNNEKYRTEVLVVREGLGMWFDKVFSSSNFGSRKPEPEFFQKILNETALSKEQIIFWDDDIHNVEGAKAFGFSGELYTDLETFRQKIRDI